MSEVDSSLIEEVCFKLLQHASIELPPDVERALEQAYQRETHPKAKIYYETMLHNIEVSRKQRRPLCQDTGIPQYYLTLGSDIRINGDLQKALDNATARATMETPLRAQVTHPFTRETSPTNVGWGVPHAFIDYQPGDFLEIIAVPKGGGAEAKSQVGAATSGAPREEAVMKIVLDAVSLAGGESCTPTIVGVAVGGSTRDHIEYLARKALYRSPLNSRHPDPQVATLEEKLYRAINKLEIGPLAAGGSTSCLAVHMEITGAHTAAGCSIAAAFYCWCSRYSKAKIWGSGKVEYITHPHLAEA